MNRFIIDWDKYAEVERQAAAEGIVLLKNENHVLPLEKGDKISVFGRIQFDYYKSGTGSGGMVNTKYVVGILDALKEEEILLNTELEGIYRNWLKNHPFDQGKGWAQEPWNQEEMPVSEELVQCCAKQSDKAVIIIGRTAGEDRDARNDKGSYLLTDVEEDLLQKVCQSFENVIVLLNTGSILDMKWVKKYNPSAVLYVWQGGMEGGHGVSDVLMGRVNPCGHLSDTIAYEITDYPSSNNFGGATGDCYKEDIYVGYRYFETFAKDCVLYPFGYGLSYTSFDTEILHIKRNEGCDIDGEETSITEVCVKIKNTGYCPGKEVVQAYVNPPQGVLGKAVRNLAAYGKTKVLLPGECEELNLKFADSAIACYDDTGKTGYESAWVLEKGTYEIYIGNNVRDAGLAGSFYVNQTTMLKQCQEALRPVKAYERMCAGAAGEDSMLTARWEDVSLRSYSMTERMKQESIPEIPYAGNCGYRLEDVYDGKVSMEDFIAQLCDEELFCMVRGEGMCSPKVTPGTAAAFGGVTDELNVFGIPCGCCADGPSGIRMDCGTMAFSLPNGTCLACTFNDELVEQLYEMEGAELRKNRIDTLLGPGMNIHRNPLNGRNFEYFSEDPLLTGKMAAAELRGMHKFGVTGTLKHFAANNQEYERRMYDSAVSERALREIYLKGFEIAIKEGNARSIMTTYGLINGLYTASNYDLLTTILRKEWGFDGMVMTDWWAELNDEGMPGVRNNLTAMINSQNDVYMVNANAKENSNQDNLQEGLTSGVLDRGKLQRSVGTILRFLLSSPAMLRMMGRISEEEKDAFKELDPADQMMLELKFELLDQKLELDIEDADTSRGSELLYGIQVDEPGEFQINIETKIDAGAVAQIPFSVFVNGILRDSVTLNGTDGAFVEVVRPLDGLCDRFNYLKIYFAQGGMQLKRICLERI